MFMFLVIVTKVTGNNPIRVVDVSNKNYTMKDISGIEKKIDRLTDAVSMSLLESSTKDMFIPNGSLALTDLRMAFLWMALEIYV